VDKYSIKCTNDYRLEVIYERCINFDFNGEKHKIDKLLA